MYRAGRLRRVFRARGKLVGTSDFVVTKGYVQVRVRAGELFGAPGARGAASLQDYFFVLNANLSPRFGRARGPSLTDLRRRIG